MLFLIGYIPRGFKGINFPIMRSIVAAFRSGWTAVSPEGRTTLVFYSLGLSSLSALDAAGLYILATSGIQSFDGSSSEIKSDWLLLMIALFTLKSFFSSLISHWGLRRFARQEVHMGQNGFEYLEEKSWDEVSQLSLAYSQNVIDRGPTALIQGIMMPVATIFAESMTALVIGVAIFSLQPVTATIVLIFFTLTTIIQHKLLSHASHRTGTKIMLAQDSVYQLISDNHNLRKVLRVLNSESLGTEMSVRRERLAINRANAYFLGSLPRYFLEATLALGFLVVSGITYMFYGYESALAATSLFAVAGFRLLPVVNRIQGQVLFSLTQVPLAEIAITKKESLKNEVPQEVLIQSNSFEDLALITLENVSYTYPNSSEQVLKNISIEILKGKSYAIVGPSGSGKSTLADLLLGLIEPSSGKRSEKLNLSKSYVPQDVHVIAGSLHENVALEWDGGLIDTVAANQAIADSELENLQLELKDSTIGDGFQTVSGGQRQRIGFARALYGDPTLLILDEATSSLDGNTEHEIMKQIEQIRNTVTTITIAHRLSTIKNADQIFYLKDGAIIGVGSFGNLVSSIPEFAEQVSRSQIDKSGKENSENGQ